MKTGGQLQCFCLNFAGDEEAIAKSYGVPLFPNVPLANGLDPAFPEEPICEVYQQAAASAYFINSSLGYLVTGVNWVIRTVIITLITWIHYKTETQQLTAITLFTFLAQFFNTAFLFLFVNANMSEQPLTFGMTTGPFTDFNTGWFKGVGNVIVDAMVFNAWFPIVEIVLY